MSKQFCLSDTQISWQEFILTLTSNAYMEQWSASTSQY